jgi:hypothetical protein
MLLQGAEIKEALGNVEVTQENLEEMRELVKDLQLQGDDYKMLTLKTQK